tara:strand:+ start:1381 stop:1737 length:357 start_codon:yes stop_codon:yes gene_type:complete
MVIYYFILNGIKGKKNKFLKILIFLSVFFTGCDTMKSIFGIDFIEYIEDHNGTILDYNSDLVKYQNDPYDLDKLEDARNSCLNVTEAVINIIDSDYDKSMDDFDYTESEIESMKNATF